MFIIVGYIESEVHKQGLEDNKYRAKQAAMQDSEQNARRKFARFLLRASQLMEKEKVDLLSLKLTWKGYKGNISKEARRARDIKSFLMAISESQGPYAYRDLSDLLTLFCEEGSKTLLAEYEGELKQLLKDRVTPIRQNGMKFKVKVDRELTEANESDFRITVARLFECTPEDFLLEDIRSGCTELTYIIPSKLAESLQTRIAVSVEDFKNAKILQLTLEGLVLKHVVQFIRCRYAIPQSHPMEW